MVARWATTWMHSSCVGSYTEVTTAHCTRLNIWQLCPYICLYTNARKPNLGGEAGAYNLSMNSEHFLILCWKSTAICWDAEHVPILFGSQGKRDLGCVSNTKIMQPLIQQCCYRRLAKPAARGREPPKVQNTKICRRSSRTAFNSSARRQYAVFLLCDLRVT